MENEDKTLPQLFLSAQMIILIYLFFLSTDTSFLVSFFFARISIIKHSKTSIRIYPRREYKESIPFSTPPASKSTSTSIVSLQKGIVPTKGDVHNLFPRIFVKRFHGTIYTSRLTGLITAKPPLSCRFRTRFLFPPLPSFFRLLAKSES